MSAIETRPSGGTGKSSPGPYLAKIVSHLDPTYMGILEVQLLHEVGNDDAVEGQLHQVRYLSPFAGQTSVDYITEEDDYNGTQKSYGMWMIPPDVGTLVMVVFVDGDPKKGFWIGCIPDEAMNFQVPGNAATLYNIDGEVERAPVAEYNKKIRATTVDPTKILKPVSPLYDILEQQGLLEDDARGITTSSARREIPSAVFGISTPGPVDKRPGAPRGKVGKAEHKIAGAFVSRLGGSSFVMDDGDDKFQRRTTASEGPPDYAAVEQDEDDGLPEIPHNELIRFRTRTGHQILLHNSEDLIYIGNSRGTAWIEMTSDGKIDIYSEDSVSLHTAQDLNFYANRDINFEAGRNLNIKVAEEMHTHVLMDQILIVDQNQVVHVKGNEDKTTTGNATIKVSGNSELNVTGHIFETSGGTNETKAGGNIIETGAQIHMNGPAATEAAEAVLPQVLQTYKLPDETGEEAYDSIMRRIPTHEPWPHHENLDPLMFKPDETDRDIDARHVEDGTEASDTILTPPDYWKTYSTVTDTFSKVGPPNEEEAE